MKDSIGFDLTSFIESNNNFSCSFIIDFIYSNRYKALSYIAKKIDSLNIFERGKEHESVHYVEDTYFKWINNNTIIKLFWCDEKDNIEKICMDVKYTKEGRDKIIKLINFIENNFSKCKFDLM